MAKFAIKETDYLVKQTDDKKKIRLIKKDKFDSFDESVLGLGDITEKANQIDALSVIFDLEGFTNFCKQIDPQLAVPEYLSQFLSWLFSQIRQELINQTYSEGYNTYSDLPFLAKYLGDGVLFLWDVSNLSNTGILNIVVSMRAICNSYVSKFLPAIANKVVSPPSKLRCGIARGAIYSVGNGNDFIGPCINVSARLQKLHSLTFCFSRRGINPEHIEKNTRKYYVTKKVDIRGIGNDELVCLLKHEYDILEEEDKSKFKDV
jgi:hypothetical protein